MRSSGTAEMATIPDKLARLLETFAEMREENERVEVLLDFAQRFTRVPDRVASRPFPEERRVPFCESEAYVWVEDQPNDSLRLYFAVENPAGVSAKALAYILDRTLSGASAVQIAAVSPDIVSTIFRNNISMGKGMGLMAMVRAVQKEARKRLTGWPADRLTS